MWSYLALSWIMIYIIREHIKYDSARLKEISTKVWVCGKDNLDEKRKEKGQVRREIIIFGVTEL